MAFIHEKSQECAVSNLDIFSVPMSQTSIDSCTYSEYHPISNITDGAPIEFSISGTGLEYIDLQNTQLYVKLKVVQGTGANLAANAQVSPVNLLLHSLFSQIDVSLNENLVSSSHNTYPYKAYLQTLLSYGQNAKSSQLTTAMYYADTAGKMDEINPHAEADALGNKNLKTRHKLIGESKTVDMVGRLHVDLFFQDKYLLSETNVRLRLLRNKDAFCLMAAENSNYKIKILECKLLVRKVKLSPTVYMGHTKALNIGTAKYPIRRVVCKSFTIPAGNYDFTHENMFQGQCPTRLIIGLVSNEAFNGVYNKNPFNFKHYDLRSLKIFIDGQEQNTRPITANYPQNLYINAYQSLFTATGKWGADEGLDISREMYSKGYTLYCYDLTNDLAPDDNHFSLIKTASIRSEMTFGTALPETVNVICLAEFENIIEIDKNRNIHFDYST